MSTKGTFHELMKPYLINLVVFLRQKLAEENAPEKVEKAYMAQFQELEQNAESFENFIEQTMILFWKEKEGKWFLDFEEMESKKKATEGALDAAMFMKQITAEQYADAKHMMSYEMKPETKEKFRRYLAMFCHIRHDANKVTQ